MNNELNKVILKEKIAEKEQVKLKYKEKLELIKQHYGVEFDVYYLKNEHIDKMKFYNLEYKNFAKNITLIYDKKIEKFNYIFFDYDNEQAMKNYDEKKIIDALNREKKIKLVVVEVKRANEEYHKLLIEIDEKYNNKREENINELELRKKEENS